MWLLPSRAQRLELVLDISSVCHGISLGGLWKKCPPPPNTCDLTGDVREGFSAKVIVELRTRKKLDMCDSHTKYKLLDMDEIVRCVGLMGMANNTHTEEP